MKQAPFTDTLFGPVTVRADGRAIHAMYLLQVKTPAESHAPWDYYKLIATIPPEQAFGRKPPAAASCPSHDAVAAGGGSMLTRQAGYDALYRDFAWAIRSATISAWMSATATPTAQGARR